MSAEGGCHESCSHKDTWFWSVFRMKRFRPKDRIVRHWGSLCVYRRVSEPFGVVGSTLSLLCRMCSVGVMSSHRVERLWLWNEKDKNQRSRKDTCFSLWAKHCSYITHNATLYDNSLIRACSACGSGSCSLKQRWAAGCRALFFFIMQDMLEGWGLGWERGHYMLVLIWTRGWVQDLFFTFFSIARSLKGVVNIFLDFSENNSWMLMKNVRPDVFRDWVCVICCRFKQKTSSCIYFIFLDKCFCLFVIISKNK